MENLTLKEQNAVLRGLGGKRPRKVAPPARAPTGRGKRRNPITTLLLWSLIPPTFAWAAVWVPPAFPLLVVFPPLGMALWAVGCAPIAAVISALLDRRK